MITGKTLQGNCGAVRCLEPGHYVCFLRFGRQLPHAIDAFITQSGL